MTAQLTKSDKLAFAFAVISQVIGGLTFLFTKQILMEVPTIAMLFWRFAFAFVGLNLLVLFRVLKISFKGKPLRNLLIICAFEPLTYFVFESLGLQLTTSVESGIIIAVAPVIKIIFSALLLRESPTKAQFTAIILSFVGVLIIVISKGFSASFNLVGYMYLLIAVIAGALYSVFTRKAAKNFSTSEITYFLIGSGALGFFIGAAFYYGRQGKFFDLFRVPFQSTNVLFSLFYLGIVASVVGYLMITNAYGKLGVNRVAITANICTLVAIAAGIIFLHESITVLQCIGTAIILLGLWWAGRPSPKLKIGITEPLHKLVEPANPTLEPAGD